MLITMFRKLIKRDIVLEMHLGKRISRGLTFLCQEVEVGKPIPYVVREEGPSYPYLASSNATSTNTRDTLARTAYYSGFMSWSH